MGGGWRKETRIRGYVVNHALRQLLVDELQPHFNYPIKPATNKAINTTMEHKLLFTDEVVSELFGKEAAEDESLDRLQSYYVKNTTHERLVSDLPLRILVGHKGIGKSAIFTIARHEDEEAHRVSILMRPDDIANLGKDSNDFDQMIRDWKTGLLQIISDKICSSIHVVASQNTQTTSYVSMATQFIPYIKKFFQAKLEENGIDGTDKILVENFLRNNRIIVYIDDLDRGWQSKPADIQRISALLNAVRDLSNDNQGLQFRISLRTDVYYLVRTSDESTDKIGDSVIWHNWSNHEILLLLIKRIQSYFKKEFNVDSYRDTHQSHLAHFLDSVFEKRFTGCGKWENAPMYVILMSLIRKRPRDLVKLCNAAAKNAYENRKNKIGSDCLQNVFVTYSQDRIQDTINEYRSELKDIERLLLNMKPSNKERRNNKGYIYDTQGIYAKLNTIMQGGKFCFTNGKTASNKDLLHFLYKINFITARKRREDGYIDRKYFEENKYLTNSTADFGYDWEIHPAFRWALNPERSSILYKEIELSAD